VSHEVIRNITIWQSAYNFLFDYASLVYRFQVTTSYLPKVANFNLPHLHLVLFLGMIPFEFRKDFVHISLESRGYRVAFCVNLALAALIQYWA